MWMTRPGTRLRMEHGVAEEAEGLSSRLEGA